MTIPTCVIQNKLIPWPGFTAITLFGLVFTRDRRQVTPAVLRHELIHCQQQLEWLYIPFFIIYLAQWLWYLVKYRGDSHRAYMSISFEREAYAHMYDETYLTHRRHYANFRHPRPTKP